MSKVGAIRNKEGIWINSNYFSEDAKHFRKHGYYCGDKENSAAWYSYWKEQRKRCREGFTVGGATITGDHYNYLNFCPIMKLDVKTSKFVQGSKVRDFPDFWDGDYNYFWVREIARRGVLVTLGVSTEEIIRINELPEKEKFDSIAKYYDSIGLEVRILPNYLQGGYDVIVMKSRRKGYSYKNSSIGVNNYFHRPNSYTMYMAYDKKYLYPKGIFSMAREYINFINENTAFTMPSDNIDRLDHIRASYTEYKDGIKIEKGFKSEIQAISFKDNPQAGIGKDAYDIIGEEVGSWGSPGGLRESLASMQPSTIAGANKTGLITFFGTSNDIEKGTVDFAHLFENPEKSGFLPMKDVWKEDSEKIEGFFHPSQWNLEGYYDESGNSDLEGASKYEVDFRQNLADKGATSSDIALREREFPLNSTEALSSISMNKFPVAELSNRLQVVRNLKLQEKKGNPCEVFIDKGRAVLKPILDNSVTPITSLDEKVRDKKGCVVVYEFPIANARKGLYKIGYDPIREEKGSSLVGIVVMKGTMIGDYNSQSIVAEYVGRMDVPDDNDHIAEILAMAYNTTIMHENMVIGVRTYFRKIKKLNLLAYQPDKVISKSIKNSKVARVYGCHMNDQLIDAGERYTYMWLTTIIDYDENGNPVRVLDRIYSQRLLEELIRYTREGNFDLVSALFMCLFQAEEEELSNNYIAKEKNVNVKNLLKMIKTQYKKK